jgi:transposase
MPQYRHLSRLVLLPELKLVRFYINHRKQRIHVVEKHSEFEVCPRCATPSNSIYDRRRVAAHDAPIRDQDVWLEVVKRRFSCKPCRRPFTEPIQGIRKGKRMTERYKRSLLWACETFTDLKRVKKHYRCSTWTIYNALYEHLEINLKRHINYPWPKTIGIDEHFFSRSRGYREFATVLVDYNNKRVRELVLGRSRPELEEALKEIPGRENVKNVVLDLSDPYKSFTKNFFPNAKLIADKFHVLRLLNPTINRYRKEITGDKRSNPIRRLLLRNGKNLEYFKESLHGFYRINHPEAATRVLTKITDAMALCKIPEIKTLRRTLMRWRNEILNYFENRITNARTEGFNNVAKLIQKRAYGVKSFKFYRLRYLNACV